jgi:hypothetical protein
MDGKRRVYSSSRSSSNNGSIVCNSLHRIESSGETGAGNLRSDTDNQVRLIQVLSE